MPSQVFGANNQLLGSTTYDAAGNQQLLNGNTLTYDAENHVVSVSEASGSTETLAYDGGGQRVEKIVGSAATVYVYDAFGQMAAEYSTASQTPACTTCHLIWDHLGSTRLVTDQSGGVVGRHDYLPFGEEIPGNSAGRNNQWGLTTDVSQKFTGQYRDSETGLDFFNARYFGEALGRFTSPDPANAGADLTNPQSWNAYSYVWNNPMGAVDPSGMDPGDGGCNDDPCCGGWDFPPPLIGWGGPPPSPPPPPVIAESQQTGSPLPPGSFPNGESLGLPPGMSVPLPGPSVLLGLGDDCEFGLCVGGIGAGLQQGQGTSNGTYDSASFDWNVVVPPIRLTPQGPTIGAAHPHRAPAATPGERSLPSLDIKWPQNGRYTTWVACEYWTTANDVGDKFRHLRNYRKVGEQVVRALWCSCGCCGCRAARMLVIRVGCHRQVYGY